MKSIKKNWIFYRYSQIAENILRVLKFLGECPKFSTSAQNSLKMFYFCSKCSKFYVVNFMHDWKWKKIFIMKARNSLKILKIFTHKKLLLFLFLTIKFSPYFLFYNTQGQLNVKWTRFNFNQFIRVIINYNNSKFVSNQSKYFFLLHFLSCINYCIDL